MKIIYANAIQYTHMAKLNINAAHGFIKATPKIMLLQISPIFSFRVVCLICFMVMPSTNNPFFRFAAYHSSLKPRLTSTK